MTSSSKEWISHEATVKKHWLTVLHHSQLIYVPIMDTFGAFIWMGLVNANLSEWPNCCSWVFFGLLLKPLYRHFTLICLWDHGNEPQSQWGKAKTIGRHPDYQPRDEQCVAFPGKTCSYACVDRRTIFQIISQL